MEMNKDDATKEDSTVFVCRVCFSTEKKYEALRKKFAELGNGVIVTKLTPLMIINGSGFSLKTEQLSTSRIHCNLFVRTEQPFATCFPAL